MKVVWKTIGIATAVAAGASIITSGICKCTERARKTFKKNDSEKKESK